MLGLLTCEAVALDQVMAKCQSAASECIDQFHCWRLFVMRLDDCVMFVVFFSPHHACFILKWNIFSCIGNKVCSAMFSI